MLLKYIGYDQSFEYSHRLCNILQTEQESKKKYVSFRYVIHDMDYRFFTYCKNKSDTSGLQSEVNEEYISVYKVAVEGWRNELKVLDSERMLVDFAWCHDEELALGTMLDYVPKSCAAYFVRMGLFI